MSETQDIERVAKAIYANQCKGVNWGTVADPIEDTYPPYEEMADTLREDARAAIEAMKDSIAVPTRVMDLQEDIHDIATAAFMLACGQSSHEKRIAVIAKALLAREKAATARERERCAEIADEIVQPGIPGTSEWLGLGNFAGQIAAAIRRP